MIEILRVIEAKDEQIAVLKLIAIDAKLDIHSFDTDLDLSIQELEFILYYSPIQAKVKYKVTLAHMAHELERQYDKL
jgi:hypothetical protein